MLALSAGLLVCMVLAERLSRLTVIASAGKLSKSADVYAFGVLLWEMYTGQRPWSGLGQMQIIFHLTQRKKKLQFPSETPSQLQVRLFTSRAVCMYVVLHALHVSSYTLCKHYVLCLYVIVVWSMRHSTYR